MIAEVVLSINSKNVDRPFDYIIPVGMDVSPGARVSVPFGGGTPKEGYVVGLKPDSDYPPERLKSVLAVKDGYSVFSESSVALARFMSGRYWATMCACLQCMLPPGLSMGPLKLLYARLEDNAAEAERIKQKGGKQAEVIKLLESAGGSLAIADICARLGVSRSPLETLNRKGIISFEPVEIPRSPFLDGRFEKTEPPVLTDEQKTVYEALAEKLAEGYQGNKTALLHGVTGSGKTEIYMRFIEKAIAMGKQAIMLVPEISLTPQTVRNFAGRFEGRVSVTHSRLSGGERFDQWRRAKTGGVSVMIGPRSAIFTPFDNLGVIIIDEEHEHTYKSETTPKYAVKELAAELSRLCGCVVVLGSATPSVETYHEALSGRIDLLELNERINKNPPAVSVIDMRRELKKGNVSIFGTELRNAIAENLAKKELTMLFLNRRGHSTFVSCRACGHVLGCGDCSINYTYHLSTDRLLCHYCGKEGAVPLNCPVCGSRYIKYFGAGTQKIEEELNKIFPAARVLRMDMDTTSKKHGHEKIYRAFLSGEADILVGTQMIAKGFDFPRVTLVGIIAADISIHMGDFRSAEKTFQLLTQVSGRAGRADMPGRAFIQTYNPEHYSIRFACSGDYKGFYEREALLREKMSYPPFASLFAALVSGEDEKKLVAAMIALKKIMDSHNADGRFDIYNPSPAAAPKIKGVYRWKIIVKSADEESLRSFALLCLSELRNTTDLNGLLINETMNPLNIP